MESLSRISEDGFQPTDEDILKLRTVTLNISETIFHIQDMNFHFFDVSGLKYHRKYWIPYFDNVTTILFVSALSSYNQMMVEEGTTNRMIDSLYTFKQIATHPNLQHPSILLFLNKKDLFEEKMKKYPLSEYFAEFTGIFFSMTKSL